MDIIQEIKNFAEKYFTNNKDSAHNMDHVMRVYNLAIGLSKGEKVDLEVIRAAVLLHDISGLKEQRDSSGKTDHAIESAKISPIDPLL